MGAKIRRIEVPPVDARPGGPTPILRMLFSNPRSFAVGVENEIGHRGDRLPHHKTGANVIAVAADDGTAPHVSCAVGTIVAGRIWPVLKIGQPMWYKGLLRYIRRVEMCGYFITPRKLIETTQECQSRVFSTNRNFVP